MFGFRGGFFGGFLGHFPGKTSRNIFTEKSTKRSRILFDQNPLTEISALTNPLCTESAEPRGQQIRETPFCRPLLQIPEEKRSTNSLGILTLQRSKRDGGQNIVTPSDFGKGKSKRGLTNVGLSPKFSEKIGGKSVLDNRAFLGPIGAFSGPIGTNSSTPHSHKERAEIAPRKHPFGLIGAFRAKLPFANHVM